MNVIDENFASSPKYNEDSFVGTLHEEACWKEEKYIQLKSEVIKLIGTYQGQASLPRDVSFKIVKIFVFIHTLILCHHNPNDAFKIMNETEEFIDAKKDEVEGLMFGYFQGEVPKWLK